MSDVNKVQEYVAEISFNLNLENKKSSKVNIGEVVAYDGRVATHTAATGTTITGETRSLRSAITSGWLIPKNGKKPEIAPVNTPKVQEDYNNRLGGNFDTFVKKTNDSNIIQEKDLIVKNTQPIKKGLDKPVAPKGKLEVAGDQVSVKEVREPLSVTSSTSVARTKTHMKTVQESDSFGADSTMPLNMKKGSTEAPKKKKTFTVDASTPAVHEEATLEEVKRATKAVEPLEDQGGTVVKKIKQGSMQIQQMDGVTLKKTESLKDMTITTKVGSGGDAAVDISTSTDTVVVKTAKGYSAMLPEDWKNMHWVKKEKWIKSQTDQKLLEYLLSVEDLNAIINACKERLKELSEG
jgi:hypothetical protein